jgi:hypothetical protein
MSISVRRRALIPEGETAVVKIVDGKQVTGQFSPQLELDFEVLKGQYKGQRIRDWAKLVVDEDTKRPYVADNTKPWEVILAAYGGDEKKAEQFSDPKELVGKVIVGQVDVRGKKIKRNGLVFGTIFAYRNIEAEMDELPFDEGEPDK